ncbi:MAG: hypothetical protein ACMG6E_01825, partial [Candidatus Roizmanbacteria bacterium]
RRLKRDPGSVWKHSSVRLVGGRVEKIVLGDNTFFSHGERYGVFAVSSKKQWALFETAVKKNIRAASKSSSVI